MSTREIPIKRDLVSHVSSDNASLSATDTDIDIPNEERALGSPSDAYQFKGVQHIFTAHTKAVTTIQFAHQNKDLLCFASSDCKITFSSALKQPSVLQQFSDHTRGVTDFEWSMTNEFLVSASLDNSIRIWDVNKGACLRIIYDDAPVTCVRFHPFNNNIVVAGTASGRLKVYNVSTGKAVQKISVGAPVTCVTFDPNGHLLFAGDARGHILIYEVSGLGQIGNVTRISVSHRAVTSVEYMRWQRKFNTPSLLVSTCDNVVRFFSYDAHDLSRLIVAVLSMVRNTPYS